VVFLGSEVGKIGTFEELAKKDAWIMSRQLTAKAFLPCQNAMLSPVNVSRETLKKSFL
jgi:DNA-binding GntR family transcriptional regulator